SRRHDAAQRWQASTHWSSVAIRGSLPLGVVPDAVAMGGSSVETTTAASPAPVGASYPDRPAASPRTISAAGTGRAPLAFCPDHRAENSALPCFSAAARKGAEAAVASGN